MEQKPNPAPGLGFYSADGFFQPVSMLSAGTLEYVSKSVLELETLMQDHLLHERYEKCAVIRDELLKRKTS